jgi:uncharacterized membrane protein
LNLRDPESMNAVVGRLLRYGVLLSALIVTAGTIRLATASGLSDTDGLLAYSATAVPHGAFTLSVSGFFKGLAVLDPYSVIELGVILLIATPVARVTASVLLFAAERDRNYVVITAVVLGLLLFSVLGTPFIPAFHG